MIENKLVQAKGNFWAVLEKLLQSAIRDTISQRTGMVVITSLLSLWLMSCKLSAKQTEGIDATLVSGLPSANSNPAEKALPDLHDYVWKPRRTAPAKHLCEMHFKEGYASIQRRETFLQLTG